MIAREYMDFRLCREMRLRPDELEEMPAEVVDRWLSFLTAEGRARKRAQDRAESEMEKARRRAR